MQVITSIQHYMKNGHWGMFKDYYENIQSTAVACTGHVDAP